MAHRRVLRVLVLLAALAALLPSAPRAEILEEIVAKVDDDVITRTEFLAEEQGMLAEVYRSASGPELDAQAADMKRELLRRMIERKILLHRAERLYDMDKLGQSLMQQFLAQQQIPSEAELEKLLTQERMTLAQFRRRLIESWVPDEVIQFEVRDRISVSDKEVEAYYQAHPEEFRTKAEVTLREVVLLAETPERKAERRAEAEAVRARLAAPGADFGAVATEVSEAGTRSEGGLLGPLDRADLAEELARAVSTQEIGAVGPVLEVPYGFHIVKVESRSEAVVRPLEEVREEVRKRLLEQQYRKEYATFMDRSWKEATVWVNPKYADRLSRAIPSKPAA